MEGSQLSMSIVTLAPGNRGKGLDNNFGELVHSSKKPHKPKRINRLKTLQEIANSWVERGYYTDTALAYQALIEGVVE